jgi:hypothetical protein
MGLTNNQPKETSVELIVTLRPTLSDHAASNNGEHREDSDVNQAVQGLVSNDEEPGWVIGTFTKIAHQVLKRFLQMQMKLDKSADQG